MNLCGKIHRLIVHAQPPYRISNSSSRRQYLGAAHRVQVLHSQEVEVHEPVHAVGQAAFLILVQLRALDVSGDALSPADLRQLVGFYAKGQNMLADARKHADVGILKS